MKLPVSFTRRYVPAHFGEQGPRINVRGHYLFLLYLKDKKTLVITINAFAYEINRIMINDYFAC
jgi:hypothetical protein